MIKLSFTKRSCKKAAFVIRLIKNQTEVFIMKFWRNVLLICSGIVVGSLVAKLCEGVKYLSWLAFGLTFGTTSPFSIDLGVLSLTVGASIDITISTIIFVILFYVVGRKLIR